MDLSRLKWTKNIRPYQGWAYKPERGTPIAMELPEAKIFGLTWKTKAKGNAGRPQEGDLILLHQQARVTHIAEFLDNKLYKNTSEPEWGIYRVVRAVWMPPLDKDWYTLPHQDEIFGFNVSIWNGLARNLDAPGTRSKFYEHWTNRGGLVGFQNHLVTQLSQIS
ncbi:MAG: hypothetical protein WBG73_14930 [Coleofasciculaceae cyanobacterium]